MQFGHYVLMWMAYAVCRVPHMKISVHLPFTTEPVAVHRTHTPSVMVVSPFSCKVQRIKYVLCQSYRIRSSPRRHTTFLMFFLVFLLIELCALWRELRFTIFISTFYFAHHIRLIRTWFELTDMFVSIYCFIRIACRYIWPQMHTNENSRHIVSFGDKLRLYRKIHLFA